MPKNRTKARSILSVPVTPEQRAELERRAGRQPISAFARKALFPANDNDLARETQTRAKTPLKETAALASVLALLGSAAHVLKHLAQGIASGILPFTPDTEAAILKACRDIADIKALVMKALGIGER